MIATKKSPDISLEEFEYYTSLHCGKKMVIKVSGGEFEKPEFSELIDTIHLLLENDITIFLVFGGGVQIDSFWKKFSENPREKKDGVGVTTPEVLENAVLPVYDFLTTYLSEKFSDMPFDTNILEPKDLQLTPTNEFGLVGNPQKITVDNSKSLHIIGFVGEDENGQQYNVNADEVALSLAVSEDIDEVIFITGTGGVLDDFGNVLSKVFVPDLEAMISGKFPHVSVSGGMKKKCLEVLEMLKSVPKVAMAKSSTLQKELFTHKGAGTLCLRGE
jgi:acetylglutamate kinase